MSQKKSFENWSVAQDDTYVCAFPVKIYGGGLIIRVVSNSLDIYTIGFTSKYSFMDDMNKNVFMPCIITGMNFRKFPKVGDTEKVPCPNWIVAIVVKCDLR